MNETPALQFETGPEPDATVIWLHGLGADGNDFAPIIPELKLPDSTAIRFIFPHAPIRPITVNQGMEMRGWYDITSIGVAHEQDSSGIEASSELLCQLCDQQIALGIAANRLILAGFSQGGVIALHCGLQYSQPLAGIMALSTYLPTCCDLNAQKMSANNAVRLFMGHGQSDDIIAIHHARQSRQKLEQAGYTPLWREYPMAHSVCQEEISDIREWILSALAQPWAK